ncbi:hypothetical protein GIB67_013686, partial [Kingdonia uniflora]
MLIKRKVKFLMDILAWEELNAEIKKLYSQVVDLEAMNLAESTKFVKKLEENIAYDAQIDMEMTHQKNFYARLESRLEKKLDMDSIAIFEGDPESAIARLRKKLGFFILSCHLCTISDRQGNMVLYRLVPAVERRSRVDPSIAVEKLWRFGRSILGGLLIECVDGVLRERMKPSEWFLQETCGEQMAEDVAFSTALHRAGAHFPNNVTTSDVRKHERVVCIHFFNFHREEVVVVGRVIFSCNQTNNPNEYDVLVDLVIDEDAEVSGRRGMLFRDISVNEWFKNPSFVLKIIDEHLIGLEHVSISLRNIVRMLRMQQIDVLRSYIAQVNIVARDAQGDHDGHDVVVVDAMHKANFASRICHSCHPNCEAKVIVVDGVYQIGVHTVCLIGYGEEITFDFNSVTESKEEYEASVCLCGSQVYRGSYLNLTGEGDYQKAENVYNQRLQNLVITLDKVRYVMRFVFGNPKKASPPLEKLTPEKAHDPLGSDVLLRELQKSLL